MNLTRWSLVVFGIVAALFIALLMAIPLPYLGERGVDPRTGKRIRGPEVILYQAKRFGDATRALSHLEYYAHRSSDSLRIDHALAILRRELEAPKRAEVDKRRLRELAKGPHGAFVSYLKDLENDAAIARATETFFNLGPIDGEAPGPDATAHELFRQPEKRDCESCLQLAKRFTAVGRTRAAMRWLLRAYETHPDNDELQLYLIDRYIAAHRLEEAYAVTIQGLHGHEHDAEFWKRRATLASWLGAPADEADALEHYLKLHEDLDARRRLVDIYPFLGVPERAVPHAILLSAGANDLSENERAALLALESGELGEGVELLEKLAERSEDPIQWRKKIAALYVQNLDLDRAITVYEQLLAKTGDREIEKTLEGLYRRTDKPAKLLALLRRQLARNPMNFWIRDQVLNLLTAAGEHEKARKLVREAAALSQSPQTFYDRLVQYDTAGVEGLADRAWKMAFSPELQASDIRAALESLRYFVDRPEFRDVALLLSLRFPKADGVKQFRLLIIDRAETDHERAVLAEELAICYPDDLEVLRAWRERAAWAGDREAEIRARERILEVKPDDSENRFALADLYMLDNEPKLAIAHWRELIERDGVRSPAVDRLSSYLINAGKVDEGLKLLEERASDPNATVEERLIAGEQLFFRQKLGQALVYYRAVLSKDGDNRTALLRLGQIHSWTNDPRGAIPYFEHALSVATGQESLIHFYLGESYWAIGEFDKARSQHALALEQMNNDPDPSVDAASRLARSLTRLERFKEATPLYRKLIAEDPENEDLLLDYAEALIGEGDLTRARSLVDRVNDLDPNNRRLLRLDGQLAKLEGNYESSSTSFESSISLHGPEAGVYADLGIAQELTGDWKQSLDSYSRWFQLQENETAEISMHRLRDALSNHVALLFTEHRVADDLARETAVHGSLLLDKERTRLGLGLGRAKYNGRAAAVGSGLVDVTEDLDTLDLSFDRRIYGANRIAAGATLYSGKNTGDSVGGWAAVHLEGSDPYWLLEARGYADEVFKSPTAAVGLEGRASGFEMRGFRMFDQRFWLGTSMRVENLEITPPGAARTRDGNFVGSFDLGFRLRDGNTAAASRYRERTIPHLSTSPYLAGAPEGCEDLLVNAWLTYQTNRLFDGADLAQLIPIGERFDYLFVNSSVDKQVTTNLGARVEAYVGSELHSMENIWGAQATMTWRPSQLGEITLGGGTGRALGRSTFTDTITILQLQVVLRF